MQNSKRVQWVSVLLFLALVGCSQTPGVTLAPGPDLSSPKPAGPNTNLVAKSEIVPKLSAQLSFTISGRVERVAVNIGDQVRAGDLLVQLEVPVLRANVASAESALRAAQIESDYQNGQLKSARLAAEITQARYLASVANEKIIQASQNLIIAQNMLQQASMSAPFAGTIIDVQVTPGEVVYQGKVLITLADLHTLRVETIDLSELDVPKVHVGQAASIYVDSLNTDIKGSVLEISGQASNLGNGKVYRVTLGLDHIPPELRWGMSAESTFISDP